MRAAVVISLAALASLVQVSAQEADEIDRERIEAAVRAAEGEAAEFAAEVAGRADAFADEAWALRESVLDRMALSSTEPGEGVIDFHAMLQGAPRISEAATGPPPATGVLIFASFSMPEESLKALVHDAHTAGVPVLLRGFVGGSLGDTARAMHALLADDGETGAPVSVPAFLGGVVVDPRAFRIFDITHVPAFIAMGDPLPDCDGLDCSAPPPPHDRIAGNMSLAAALEALAEEGRSAPDQARAARERLESRP